ncbi:MAG: ribonuclease H-like domain-containing protein, partial [Persicimonas sp.]
MGSNFKKRLKRLHDSRQGAQSDRSEARGVYTAEGVDEVAASDDDTGETGETAVERWRREGARTRSTPRGPAHYLACAHRADHVHGDRSLRDGARSKAASLFSLVDDDLAGVSPRDLVYVDLETTGLSKSCYPFCVGIGLWEESSFDVYHYFMPTGEGEDAILSATAEIFKRAAGLCTFNGKSFDLKMLRRRFDHHGIEHNLDGVPHVDLLPLSRRLFPDRDSHRLARLEEDVLGFERHDDIPGAQIPGRWKRYLREERPALLENVFDHNRLDVLSMVVLLAQLAEVHRPGSLDAPDRENAGAPEVNAAVESADGSTVAGRLSRSYQLRKRAGHGDDGARSGGSAASQESGEQRGGDRVEMKANFSRSSLRAGMPVGGRLRELRVRAEWRFN